MHITASGKKVEVVDILCDDSEPLMSFFHFDERIMACVRLNRCDELLPMPVPFPYEVGIVNERIEIRQFFRFEFVPDAIISAKGRNTAFCRNSRPRQDCDILSLLEYG